MVGYVQGVWTDGDLIATVGLDQRMRTWKVIQHPGSGGLTTPGSGDATTCGTALRESSDKEADACTPVSDAHSMCQVSLEEQGSEQVVAAASRPGVNFGAEVASKPSHMSVRETGSIVLQVLEPSALHVSRTAGEQPLRTVAVVGRGTQIVLCSAEGGI